MICDMYIDSYTMFRVMPALFFLVLVIILFAIAGRMISLGLVGFGMLALLTYHLRTEYSTDASTFDITTPIYGILEETMCDLSMNETKLVMRNGTWDNHWVYAPCTGVITSVTRDNTSAEIEIEYHPKGNPIRIVLDSESPIFIHAKQGQKVAHGSLLAFFHIDGVMTMFVPGIDIYTPEGDLNVHYPAGFRIGYIDELWI